MCSLTIEGRGLVKTTPLIIKYLLKGNWTALADDPSTIRVASVIAFSVLCLSVLCYFFLILLQYNIWWPHTNCNVYDPEFALRVNLRRHDTLKQTAMYVMPIFH